MKSESKTLVWGTIIAVTLVAIASIKVTRFPDFHLPISDEWLKFDLATALLIVILIFSYKSLLRRPYYWLLLSAFLVVHVAFYVFFFSSQIGGPLQDDIQLGTMAGLEFVVFALVIFGVYRVAPNMKWMQ